jgi:hypothetical protein
VARICRSQSSTDDQIRQGRGSIPRFGIGSFFCQFGCHPVGLVWLWEAVLVGLKFSGLSFDAWVKQDQATQEGGEETLCKALLHGRPWLKEDGRVGSLVLIDPLGKGT